MVDGVPRDLQRPAERGKKDAERKHAGEQPFLIDAERGDHVAILRRGADQHTPARALEQQPEDSEHHRPEHDQEQIVTRDVLTEEVDGTFKSGRAAAEHVARSPDQHDEVFHHQRQAEGGEQLKQFRRMVDPAQQDHLDDHADRGDDQRGRNDAGPETERTGEAFGQRERQIGAEHIERAMGEIDDPRHAEDDRQARRDQKQRRRAGKAGQELDDIEGHRRSASASLQVRGLILRDGASRLLRMRVQLLMVRSAAAPRVSNHEAR